MRHRLSWCVDLVLAAALSCLVVRPLFRLEYLKNWWSIESTFIADGRMLAENLPHRQWQPYWYCGTRADYVYPPGLRYGTAYLSKWLNTSPAHAYHIYIGVMYALGLLGVYVLIRSGTGSRLWAWIGMFAVALLSPSFALMPEIRRDSAWGFPQRLHALMWYGEGPHISALSILPFLFVAAATCFRPGRWRWIGVAALAAAAVVTNNFYGATALAMLFPVLVWCHFLAHRNWRIFAKAAAIAALAYGLTAWWLVPSYFKLTARNLRYVAEPGNARSTIILLLLVSAAMAVSYLLSRRRGRPFSAGCVYTWFTLGGAAVMVVYVLGRRWLHLQIAGDTARLIPELDLFLTLAIIEGLRRLWVLRHPAWRIVTVILVCGSFSFAARYIDNFHQEFPRDRDWRGRVEHKTATWLLDNYPDSRVLLSGSQRFWVNVWHNVTQADGGSQQGLQNERLASSQWRLFRGNDATLIKHWLTALAVDIAIVPEASSREVYHEIVHPEVWRSALPVLRDDGEGNIYYWNARRTQGIVRIVETRRMKNLPEIPADYENVPLRLYVEAIEAEPPVGDSSHRIRMLRRAHPDHVRIDADVRSGESVLFQETFDPAWRASSHGKALTIERDVMNFTLIHAPPGVHNIELRFETPLEVRIGRCVSALSMLVLAALLLRIRSTSITRGRFR